VPRAQFGVWLLERSKREYLIKAAKAGVVEAQFELALDGSADARSFCIAASDRGDVKAMELAGSLLTSVEPKDQAKGEWYLRKAIEKNLLKAMWVLAERLETTNPQEAISLWKRAADGGDEFGQLYYGDALASGRGVETDLVSAAEYHKKASDQGHPCGQIRYGDVLGMGRGVEIDLVSAAAYYKKAADQGDSEGQLRYGLCLESGRGVSIDFVSAAEYFKKSADRGNADGQLQYGVCLEEGKGVDIDLISAAEYFKKSADQGNCEAGDHYRGLQDSFGAGHDK
jgi:TPR repeat protein